MLDIKRCPRDSKFNGPKVVSGLGEGFFFPPSLGQEAKCYSSISVLHSKVINS